MFSNAIEAGRLLLDFSAFKVVFPFNNTRGRVICIEINGITTCTSSARVGAASEGWVLVIELVSGQWKRMSILSSDMVTALFFFFIFPFFLFGFNGVENVVGFE